MQHMLLPMEVYLQLPMKSAQQLTGYRPSAGASKGVETVAIAASLDADHTVWALLFLHLVSQFVL